MPRIKKFSETSKVSFSLTPSSQESEQSSQTLSQSSSQAPQPEKRRRRSNRLRQRLLRWPGSSIEEENKKIVLKSRRETDPECIDLTKLIHSKSEEHAPVAAAAAAAALTDSDIDFESDPPKKNAKASREKFRDLRSEGDLGSLSAPSKELWIDRHAPKTSSDLCVAPKKVKQVREWIEAATSENSSSSIASRLLVLVGSPGIGKSETIKVLANEMNLEFHSWSESSTPRTYSVPKQTNESSDFLMTPSSSPLSSFQEFLEGTGAGYSPLALSVGALPLNGLKSPPSRKRKSMDSLPTTQEENEKKRHRKRIILLEEIPNLHGLDAEERFREILRNHFRYSRVPVVMIYSDVSEGRHRPQDLERLVDPSDLYDERTTSIVQVHAVTKTKIVKILTTIAKAEKCCVPPSSATQFWDEFYERCQGDLRHAILALQFQLLGLRKLVVEGEKKGKINSDNADTSIESRHRFERDVNFSTFHALGKVMYAKRREITEKDETGKLQRRTVLSYDPEDVMGRSDMGLGGSLTFLAYHSVDFFTDSTELSDAYAYYSDAAMMLDNSIGRSSSGGSSNRTDTIHYPDGYVASLAGRAVAATNTHPTPNKFRQFSSPRIFDVMRKRRANQASFRDMFQRQLRLHVSSRTAYGPADALAADYFPAMRIIHPNDSRLPDSFLSASKPSGNAASDRKRQREELAALEAGEEMRLLREQAEILEGDDIVEDDDEDDDDEFDDGFDLSLVNTSNASVQPNLSAAVVSPASLTDGQTPYLHFNGHSTELNER